MICSPWKEKKVSSLNYDSIPSFENIYLEDSYVLSISSSQDYVFFLLDLVLTEAHPAYANPSPEEQYCYRKAHLKFQNANRINWIKKNMNKFTDANKEIDYGNIDVLCFSNQDYYICGDWGELEINSPPPTIEIFD